MLDAIRWGSATAAYQVEGGADADGRSPSIWDVFAATPGKVTRGDTGAIACDTYTHPERVIDQARWLGLETYRLSVSWSRVVPAADGRPNQEGLDYYRRLVDGLLSAGIRPAVTLYHWDLPQWLQESGGWSSTATAQAFVEYVRVVHAAIGDLVDDWFTINEPFCAAFHGHLSGLHAPGTHDEATALRAVLVQLQAHSLAVGALRSLSSTARVGLAMNLSDLEGAGDDPADLAALRRADLVENRLFLDLVLRGSLPADAVEYFGAEAVASAVEGIEVSDLAVPMDFIGINYYEHNVVRAAEPGTDIVVRGIEKLPVPEPRSANGVAVHPEGFTRVLLRVAEEAPGLPIWVTENGIGLWDYLGTDGRCNDVERVAFLEKYMAALSAAVEAGANVEAYFFWALMDNFEWSHGYQLRYGLFHTHYPTGELVPKASAEWYRDYIDTRRRARPTV